MQTRFQNSPGEIQQMTTGQLRDNFLVRELMQPGKLTLIYTHYDRMIIGGVSPATGSVSLGNEPELRSDYFLERRELGVINVGGDGIIDTNDRSFELGKLDCLYIGKSTARVEFKSKRSTDPAMFYLLSAPAHHAYQTRRCTKQEASPVSLGDAATSNRRTIYKYIHADGIESCQLVMGLTVLETGSAWNSVPPHTHTRRMEAYFYFDLPADQRVFHFMGEPNATRHVVMQNHEAIISPPWSVHFGCGTSNYGFIWGMAGENKAFSDMDPAPIDSLL